MVADNGYSTGAFFQGSENFSSASLTENRELGLIIANPPIMASLAGTLTSDFNSGQP
jgi:cardiolipin synthase A/B